jgi:putative transposase
MDVAATLRVAPTTVRRWVWSGEVFKRERGRALDVDVLTLPPKYRAAYLSKMAPLHLVPNCADQEPQLTGRRWTDEDVPQSVRSRATFRCEAVLSLAKARASRRDDERLADVDRRWLRNFRRSHANAKVSIRSVHYWTATYRARGMDGLLDGNDGHKLRGVRAIPAPAQQLFKDLYLRPHCPNVQLCYRAVVKAAAVNGWGKMPSYDTFRRFVESIPKMVRLLHREYASTPRTVLPYVVRDPSSIPAMHTWQSDHRHIDVPVRCDTGCPVCAGKKPKGHFPIWTAFIDIRSRRILASEISIEPPDSDRVLSVFRRSVDREGLPQRVYLDNGADYRKAFGRRLRKEGKESWDGPDEQQMQARFAPVGVEVVYALPYNAQAKLIERMFRTFRHRFDEAFEAYRGERGKWSEAASELFYRPQELPTVSELAYLLQLAIEEYNGVIPHTGRGMDGQTPDAVFAATRMPRRDPDRAFALLFFQTVKNGRIVGRNGVQYDGRLYRLSSAQRQLEYFGTRVDVRINPDDQRKAIVLDLRTGAFVCEATADDEDATYDTRDVQTRERMARVRRDERQLKRMVAGYTEGAKERLAESRGVLLQFHQEHVQIECAAVVPVLSSVAREAAEACGDGAQQSTRVCIVSRPRQPRGKKKPNIRRRRRDALSWKMIAAQLGVAVASLARYRNGASAWPPGMKEQFDALAARRTQTELVQADAVPTPARSYGREGSSWAAIARELGTSYASLVRYRSGQVPWPAGMEERFRAVLSSHARRP